MPNEFDDRHRLAIQALTAIERELARYLRNERYINQIKRACGMPIEKEEK